MSRISFFEHSFLVMSKLLDATGELLQTLRDPRTSERTINRAAKAWMKALEAPESLEEITESQRQLAGAVEWDNIERAQLALMMSGALVEQGFAPEPLLEAFAAPLPNWLEGANRLLKNAVVNGELDEEIFDRNAAQRPVEARDFSRLEALYLPLIAALAVSSRGRADLRPLLPQIEPLRDICEAGYFLFAMLRVLDDEPLLVIEPARKRGFVGMMSGIADNFQLHALLMAHYPDVAPISPAQIAVFRGDGPQANGETIVGAWNLYDYHALSQTGLNNGLEDLSDTEHWIWGEGQPVDIDKFERHRVVILGEPSYQRSWGVQRLFGGLRAELGIERELSADEVEQWLTRLAAANSSVSD